jgi:hypothetical protein
MNYSKPEVKTLGEATTVIETMQKKVSSTVIDPQTGLKQVLNPAYDLDE